MLKECGHNNSKQVLRFGAAVSFCKAASGRDRPPCGPFYGWASMHATFGKPEALEVLPTSHWRQDQSLCPLLWGRYPLRDLARRNRPYVRLPEDGEPGA
ncbi:hypothetical protein NDU88_010688 [Pleurodeles waltl]|uniref:Uncharacterized protein n=1 Tax=Pleurodeles waltl TaxID=8319 RepID=A0AAV7QV44_PLEWA|nr:hypothetical protein NDU88_010688 [Pleurodeles waltl]